MLGEGAAGVRGDHAPAEADEQVGAEGLLELAYLVRNRRLRHAECLCRGGERAELERGTEAAQLLERQKLCFGLSQAAKATLLVRRDGSCSVMPRDVVIVGGGIAGLAAAWRLRHRDVLLLESGDRLGGRMRSDQRGEYWLNYGAHLFPAPGSLVDAMARECRLETLPVPGGMMGLAVGSTILDGGRVESYPFRLPLSVRDRVAFARAGVKVQRAVSRFHWLGRPLDFEDERTFEAFLGPLPPAVRDIFACAAHRATAELDELSAGCGIGLFALVWGGKGSLIARNLLGGAGRLPAALGRALGDRAHEPPRPRDPS